MLWLFRWSFSFRPVGHNENDQFFVISLNAQFHYDFLVINENDSVFKYFSNGLGFSFWLFGHNEKWLSIKLHSYGQFYVDQPVITVITVTLVYDDRERGHNCYDHHVITVMTVNIGREVITVMTTQL